jgi:hypothetical protein
VPKGGNFHSRGELVPGLDAFDGNDNAKPKAFVWRTREVKGIQLWNRLANFCD